MYHVKKQTLYTPYTVLLLYIFCVYFFGKFWLGWYLGRHKILSAPCHPYPSCHWLDSRQYITCILTFVYCSVFTLWAGCEPHRPCSDRGFPSQSHVLVLVSLCPHQLTRSPRLHCLAHSTGHGASQPCLLSSLCSPNCSPCSPCYSCVPATAAWPSPLPGRTWSPRDGRPGQAPGGVTSADRFFHLALVAHPPPPSGRQAASWTLSGGTGRRMEAGTATGYVGMYLVSTWCSGVP